MKAHPIDVSAVIAAFPEFEIDPQLLGEGGMKSAFRIRGKDMRVLKVVREPLPDYPPEGAVSLPERIRREISGMRDINHPRIVQVLDGPNVQEIGERQRVWYIEPLFEGGTLLDRLESPWPESRCKELLVDLVEAAEVLKEHGIVHRDIKPSNVVFDELNRAVLLDLGIALFLELSALTDLDGESPRTERYAAPEQFGIRGNTTIDYRTDQFLIGMVVFEALTGVHPFSPERPGYYDRLRNGIMDVDALERVDPSPGIRHILERLLSPYASRRYRQFDHLRDDIEEN